MRADEEFAGQKSHSARAERNTYGRCFCPIGLLRSVWSGYRRGDGNPQFAGAINRFSKRVKRWLHQELEQVILRHGGEYSARQVDWSSGGSGFSSTRRALLDPDQRRSARYGLQELLC